MVKPVVIILAGGHGERLWPRSRRHFPKQFLCVTGSCSLLQATVAHAMELTSAERIYIVTNKDHLEETRKQLSAIPLSNIIIEPESRNTAPAIALAANCVVESIPGEDPPLIILSCDNLIKNPQEFYRVITIGLTFCAQNNHGVVFGISPDRPEVGCGYIALGEPLTCIENKVIYQVASFKEKPGYATAQSYIASGNYLWNAGIFIWRLSVLLGEFKQFYPSSYAGMEKLSPCHAMEENQKIEEIYWSIPALSIDYAILEKNANLAVIPANFGLEDLGSWEALERIIEKDEAGNAVQGKFCGVETEECIIYSPKKTVVTAGVSRLLIVETEDVLFVCSRERASEIKQIIGELKVRGHDDLV